MAAHTARGRGFCRMLALGLVLLAATSQVPCAGDELPDWIARWKPSVVVVGTYQATRVPSFVMRGSGFAVGDGRQIVTNAHVIARPVDRSAGETVVVLERASGREIRQRAASTVSVDAAHDLAVLRIDGPPLPALSVPEVDTVREGQSVAFVGFPIGAVLGLSPVTHRGIVSAITPIALPAATAKQLDARLAQQLRSGSFEVYQLDATAYPGNSGGPLLELTRGEVIGVLSMVFVKERKESVLSQPSGISFAIPVRFVRELLRRS